jgi:hypothetical protein
LEDLDIVGKIRMDLREIECEGTDYIHLTQVRDQWQTCVNAIMKLWVPEKVGNFLNS